MRTTGQSVTGTLGPCLCMLILFLASCGGGGGGGGSKGGVAPPALVALRLQPINTVVGFALFLTAPPGDTARAFIVEKDGIIRILDLATQQTLPVPFLNLTGLIATAGEQGLLGLAFHPDFAVNGFFYVTVSNTTGSTEIRRYRVSADPNLADISTALLVIRIDQPPGFTNHKGGWLGFGRDGFLYAALGDGGSAGDPFNNAQNIDSLLGKMLRLDVDGDDFPADAARNYAIPADNPFVGVTGSDEIWAYGLRNPWRPSFDRDTGDFYIADVGQNTREEVNVAPMSAGGAGRGLNYGWRIMEGSACFLPATGCNATSLTLPVIDYDHAGGACSVTGGYVYRGNLSALQPLRGTYFYADFCAGFVRSFRFAGGQATELTDWAALAPPGAFVTSFGEDAAGELYVMTSTGGLYRIVPN